MSDQEPVNLEKKNLPPWGATKWYTDFLALTERLQITHVDKGFLETYDIGKGNEHKIISGLKFLKIIDDKGNATSKMDLLKVVGEQYSKNLEIIIKEAYAVIFEKVNLDKATQYDLINTFITEYKMGKSIAPDAAKIFSNLANKANIPLSESISDINKTQSIKSVTRKRTTSTPKQSKKDSEPEQKPPQPPLENIHEINWGQDISIKLKKGDISSARKAKTLIEMYIQELEGT